MRHASPATLDQLEPLLAQVRAVPGIIERTRGHFYRRSAGYLHFHEDPAGLFADLKEDGTFVRYEVTSVDQQDALVRRIQGATEP